MSTHLDPSRSAGLRALRRGQSGRGWLIGLGTLVVLLLAQPGPGLPDGRIAYMLISGESEDYDIYLMDLEDGIDEEGGNISELYSSPGFDAEPEWSPDGKRIVFTSDQDGDPDIYRMDVAAGGTAAGGLASNVVNLTDTDSAGENGPIFSPACAPSDTSCRNWIAFFSDQADGWFNLYMMDEDGRDVTRLTSGEFFDAWPSWSPDGRKLVFMSDRSGSFYFDLFMLDIGSGQITQITDTPDADDWWPAWSPDGRYIAWTSNMETGWFHIWLMDADCEANCQEEARLLVDDFPVHEFDPNWSPDSKWVVFSTFRDPENEFGTQLDYEIFAAQANGPELVQITYNELTDDFTPAWTP